MTAAFRSSLLLLPLAIMGLAGCRQVPPYVEGEVPLLVPAPVDCLEPPGAPASAQRLCTTSVGLKVAFFGDQGLDGDARAVLQLVASEGAEAVVHLGDFDYDDNPEAWSGQIETVLGPDFPHFAVLGNHDLFEWPSYQRVAQSRLERLSPSEGQCAGDLLLRASCSFKGLFFVTIGIGTLGDRAAHLDHLQRALANSDAAWKVCVWHKNQHDMQPGNKGDEVGWRAYQICQEAGALVMTGHEHVYGRSRVLTAVGRREIDHGAVGANDQLSLAPGRSVVVVSGLGGRSARSASSYQASAAWWASILAANFQQTNGREGAVTSPPFGALFVTFNVDGDPYRARGYFKSIGGDVVDRFELSTVQTRSSR